MAAKRPRASRSPASSALAAIRSPKGKGEVYQAGPGAAQPAAGNRS